MPAATSRSGLRASWHRNEVCGATWRAATGLHLRVLPARRGSSASSTAALWLERSRADAACLSGASCGWRKHQGARLGSGRSPARRNPNPASTWWARKPTSTPPRPPCVTPSTPCCTGRKSAAAGYGGMGKARSAKGQRGRGGAIRQRQRIATIARWVYPCFSRRPSGLCP